MKKRTRLIILIVILFVLAHFTFSSTRTDQDILITDRLIAYVYKPISKAFNAVTDYIGGTVDNYFFLVRTKQENKELRESLNILKLKNRSLEVLLGEKKDRFKTDHTYSFLNQKLIRVNILGFDPFSQAKTLWIDAGQDQGIQINQVVLAADGLVGRVIQVYDNSSKVLLLIDSYFSVDAINDRTKMRCLIRGLRTGELEASRLPYLSKVEYLDLGHEMLNGDILVTAGLGGIYPPGIPIGRIIEVEEVAGSDYFEKSLVMPAVDFLKLQWIYVLSEEPKIIEEKPVEKKKRKRKRRKKIS